MKDNTGSLQFYAWVQAHPMLFAIMVLWSLLWTGLALWHSAKRGQYVWFFVFLIFHTVGFIEIIYLFFVLKLKLSELFSK